MPKINRIRIANVPYSGRQITDQIINCYNGQNVLVNLANGGGKSVLTQMIMQPIVPNVKIHKRKVESYLTSKEPTFVMIEWLLDNTNQPTYFLTGIIMNKTVTEENKYRVKYFTFVNEYTTANPFDIKNIDFITNKDGVITYQSYETCLRKLREQEGSLSKIETFTIDEQKRYHQKLEEIGIFKDEWKILAKINEKEGGIDDLFEKCEKSDDVINQWILKTISEKLENAEELREMFLNLMLDILNHEDEIKQKEELENFKQEVNRYTQELSELLENMDKQEQIKKQLEDIYLKLKKCISHSEEKQQILKEQLETCKKGFETIEYEQISEQYHYTQNSLEEMKEILDNKVEQVAKLETKKNEMLKQLKIMEAARIYAEYTDAKADREAAFIAKQNLEKELNQDEIKNIQYSLKIAYENQIDNIQKEIMKFQEELESIKKNKIDTRQKQQENMHKNIEIQNQLAVLKNNIENFKKKEKQILQNLELTITRNILQELDKQEVNHILQKYDKFYEEKEQKIQEKKNHFTKCEKQIEENDVCIQNCNIEIETITAQFEQKKNEIETYNQQTQQLKTILESFAIDKEKLFDKDINLIEIQRQRENVRNRNNEHIAKRNKNRDMLYRLQNGGVHVELEIGKVLEKYKIEYETGEEYLKEQTQQYQQQLLQKNPMLPYCYIILKTKDYEKIEELTINEEINQLTPIILYEDIEKDFKPINKLIYMQESIKLACLYNQKAFDKQQKQVFEKQLEQEVEELEIHIKEDENKILHIENAIKFIQEYKYGEQDEQKLQEQLNELQEKIDNTKQKREDTKETNKHLRDQLINIKDEINLIYEKLEENKQNREKFEQFIEEDKQYMKWFSEQIHLNKEMKVIENNEIEISELLEKQDNMINETTKMIENKNAFKEQFSIKNEQLEKIENAEKLEKTLEELEKMYEEIHREIGRNEQEIQEKIKKANARMMAKDKELNKHYEDVKGQYEEITYMEENEDMAREKAETIQNAWETAKQEMTDINIKKVKLTTRMENIEENLRKLNKTEPLQTYLIKKDYENRKRQLKEQIETIEKNMEILKIKTSNIETKKYSILGIIEEPEHRQVDISDFDDEQISIKELSKEFKEQDKQNGDRKRKIDNLYLEIENKSIQQNQVIQNFLKNMNPYQNENKFANYYFTYERVTECLETMDKMLQLLQTTIANIENDKHNIKHHAYIQGKNIYLEMKQISDSSDIKMPEKLRKVPLLEIELPKELDQFAQERIDNYIEDCIKALRQECKEQDNMRQIVEKRIKDWLSDRQLLNIVINTETIGVKLYKIDISEKNSGLKRWEEVIVDNSGGEKLISCLILVLALMQYTRKKILAQYGDEEKTETSKFLMIDNPFGKMSSTHLLNGLMLILDKFNVQAICLSDISQSSITNQFKVIYQMSLKSGKYTDKIYLTTDNVMKSPEITDNYVLEKAYVKVEDQLKMW